MRNLTVCVLALALMAQAVVSLECYYCPNGGRCSTTEKCRMNQDQCITMFFPSTGKFAKRCSSTYECQILMAMGGSAVQVICCDSNRCNQ
ncbi:secreted Ly-6/uPAR domain-containing protein 2-like [Malaclemys terrapin pileata]|uniref:secreted Ly-6/uPAR domain-containing protein 2-like n=1 Tax=Malaclemys terrapin pileata TaxID=2991368 RepID=UPI0023A90AF7|nr:secreted Ly-6/uPAR domain-containing protein 2-like [Malaclemys terrapin pileata]